MPKFQSWVNLYEFAATPMNDQSTIIEERFYRELFNASYDSFSNFRSYIQ